MSKLIVRAFFVLVPALVVGLIFGLLNPVIGCVMFGFMFSLGCVVTATRPERGEGL